MTLDFLHLIFILITLIVIIRLCYVKNTAIAGWEELASGKKHVNDFVTSWTQHMLYIRLLIMASNSQSPEEEYIMERLFKNQLNFSSLFAKKYGDESGHNVLYSLVEHMKNIIAFLEAIKSGDQQKFETALQIINKDATNIGAYLDQITEKNIFEDLVKKHTHAFVNNALAYHYKNYERDISTLDEFFNTGIQIAIELAHDTK